MTRGRPPKPTELKRATGNPGQRKLPELAAVVALPMAVKIPDPPVDLGVEGKRAWQNCWSLAITWLSPDSDLQSITNVCRLADDLQAARKKFHATLDNGDGRLVATLSKSFTDALTSLGFDPVSRSRLGVAEVKRVSALDQLIQKRQAAEN
jgi:hypothetical protein